MTSRRQFILASALLLLVAIGALMWTILNEPPQPTRVGYIRTVTTNGNYGILFDEVERLTGQEGERAAAESGSADVRAAFLSDGYVLRNLSTVTQPYEFWVNVAIAIRVADGGSERVAEVDRRDFERIINDPASPWRGELYEVTIKNNLVSSIVQLE